MTSEGVMHGFAVISVTMSSVSMIVPVRSSTRDHTHCSGVYLRAWRYSMCLNKFVLWRYGHLWGSLCLPGGFQQACGFLASDDQLQTLCLTFTPCFRWPRCAHHDIVRSQEKGQATGYATP